MTTVNMQCRNCEIDDDLRAHCEEKIATIDKVWPRGEQAEVRFGEERGRYSAEVTLVSRGLITRAEERSDNLRQAFDLAIDKIQRQLNRFKAKARDVKRRHNNRDDVAGTVMHPIVAPDVEMANSNGNGNGAQVEESEDNVENENVVRVKRFALKPMSAQEATLQMDLLGHDFFVFRDDDKNEVSVVYRRNSGGYGLIEPIAD